MNESGLVPFAGLGLESSDLSEQDLAVLQMKLWQLLTRRTGLYTMGDSSSVREETGQELFSSICFLLRIYLKESGASAQTLVNANAEAVLAQAIKLAEQKTEQGKQLYRVACFSVPNIENTSLTDTLKGIGSFFKKYDYRYFAHQIPCDIDYPLCHSVSETLYGIEYINEYLRRLITESNFIQRFQKGKVVGLLNTYCPDYEGLLINLYEPVATNAVGCALVGKDVHELNLTKAEQSQIFTLLEPLPRKEMKEALKKAAEAAARELELPDVAAREYLTQTAIGLYARTNAAYAAEKADVVFLSW